MEAQHLFPGWGAERGGIPPETPVEGPKIQGGKEPRPGSMTGAQAAEEGGWPAGGSRFKSRLLPHSS